MMFWIGHESCTLSVGFLGHSKGTHSIVHGHAIQTFDRCTNGLLSNSAYGYPLNLSLGQSGDKNPAGQLCQQKAVIPATFSAIHSFKNCVGEILEVGPVRPKIYQ